MNPKLTTNVEFVNNFYKLTNKKYVPLFLQNMNFLDEYEANFAYSLWLNFTKKFGNDKEITEEIIDEFNNFYFEIQNKNSNKNESNELIELNYKILSNLPNSFYIVFGSSINPNVDNVKVVNSLVIPNIGETIIYDKKVYLVTAKTITYQHVFKYDLNNSDRGKEMIFIFVKQDF